MQCVFIKRNTLPYIWLRLSLPSDSMMVNSSLTTFLNVFSPPYLYSTPRKLISCEPLIWKAPLSELGHVSTCTMYIKNFPFLSETFIIQIKSLTFFPSYNWGLMISEFIFSGFMRIKGGKVSCLTGPKYNHYSSVLKWFVLWLCSKFPIQDSFKKIIENQIKSYHLLILGGNSKFLFLKYSWLTAFVNLFSTVKWLSSTYKQSCCCQVGGGEGGMDWEFEISRCNHAYRMNKQQGPPVGGP